MSEADSAGFASRCGFNVKQQVKAGGGWEVELGVSAAAPAPASVCGALRFAVQKPRSARCLLNEGEEDLVKIPLRIA